MRNATFIGLIFHAIGPLATARLVRSRPEADIVSRPRPVTDLSGLDDTYVLSLPPFMAVFSTLVAAQANGRFRPVAAHNPQFHFDLGAIST